jgi:hypothetical protein
MPPDCAALASAEQVPNSSAPYCCLLPKAQFDNPQQENQLLIRRVNAAAENVRWHVICCAACCGLWLSCSPSQAACGPLAGRSIHHLGSAMLLDMHTLHKLLYWRAAPISLMYYSHCQLQL